MRNKQISLLCVSLDFNHALLYNAHMNKFKLALEQRGLSPADVAQKGALLTTVQKHFYGSRNVGPVSAILYEQLIGIPRSELRPDLWPPATATPATQRGGEDAA